MRYILKSRIAVLYVYYDTTLVFGGTEQFSCEKHSIIRDLATCSAVTREPSDLNSRGNVGEASLRLRLKSCEQQSDDGTFFLVKCL